jgi:hypothetical protein
MTVVTRVNHKEIRRFFFMSSSRPFAAADVKNRDGKEEHCHHKENEVLHKNLHDYVMSIGGYPMTSAELWRKEGRTHTIDRGTQ